MPAVEQTFVGGDDRQVQVSVIVTSLNANDAIYTALALRETTDQMGELLNEHRDPRDVDDDIVAFDWDDLLTDDTPTDD